MVGRTSGGAQVQIALLAKALALKGHDVVVIDPFSNGGDFVTPEGVRLLTVPGWNNGLPGLRMFTNRLPALYKLFRAQKADFYYVRTRAYVHLANYLAARKTGGKLIVAVASDIDVQSYGNQYRNEYKGSLSLFNYLGVNLPNDIATKFLQRNADIVLLQHAGQNSNLESARGRVMVFPNIIDKTNVPKASQPAQDYFVHVGSLSILKGADNLYRLVNMVKDNLPIVVVGQPNDSKSEGILQKLKEKRNVVLRGRLSHAETLEVIANAKALINTSNFEGFPNIFLEAWASGVPVISLNVNPGDVFNRYPLGVYCEGDFSKMKAAMEANGRDEIDKEQVTSYIDHYHDFSTAADRLLALLTAPAATPSNKKSRTVAGAGSFENQYL